MSGKGHGMLDLLSILVVLAGVRPGDIIFLSGIAQLGERRTCTFEGHGKGQSIVDERSSTV